MCVIRSRGWPLTDPIRVDIVTSNGSGCPVGTVSLSMAPDNTALRVLYTGIVTQVGVGARPTDFRKNCQLSVLVHVSAEFTYAISAPIRCGQRAS